MTNIQTAVSNARSRQQWAEIINSDWRKSIESIIQTGRDLEAAKAELPHGEFAVMVKDDLDFSPRMAQNLMQISAHPRIGKANRGSHLPTSWTILRTLSRLSPEDFDWAEDHGLLDKEMSRGSAVAVVQARTTDAKVIPGNKTDLPTPSEARNIARETGRFVAASDGNIYSGASKEDSEAYRTKMIQGASLLEAIETLAEAPDAQQWFTQSERHWFIDFRPGAIDDARKWLASFKEAMGVVDA